MNCFSRPDWPQYFQCFREDLAQPVYLLLPWGVWLLIGAVIAAVLGGLIGSVGWWIFGDRISRAVGVIGEWCREVCYFPYRWYRSRQVERFRREAAAEPAGETPPGPVREDPIDPAAVDRAPAGRRPEGD